MDRIVFQVDVLEAARQKGSLREFVRRELLPHHDDEVRRWASWSAKMVDDTIASLQAQLAVNQEDRPPGANRLVVTLSPTKWGTAGAAAWDVGVFV